MSTPYERLLAETIPTRPTPPEPPTNHHWTPAEQDTHWHDLCTAIGARGEQRPHLRALTTARPA